MTDQADTPDPIGECGDVPTRPDLWLPCDREAGHNGPHTWPLNPDYAPAATPDPIDLDGITTPLNPHEVAVVEAASRTLVALAAEVWALRTELDAALAELAAARDREAAVRAETHLDDGLPILAPDGRTDQWVEGWDYAIDEMWRRVRAALSQSEPTKERSE